MAVEAVIVAVLVTVDWAEPVKWAVAVAVAVAVNSCQQLGSEMKSK